VLKRPVDKNNASALSGAEFKKLVSAPVLQPVWLLACYGLPHTLTLTGLCPFNSIHPVKI
jgi:hypothetical protein